MTLSLDGSRAQSITPSCRFPGCSEKEKRDMFLRKTSNQNVLHMLMGRFMFVYLFISKVTIFLFP